MRQNKTIVKPKGVAKNKDGSTANAIKSKKLSKLDDHQYHHGDLKSTLIDATLKMLESIDPSELSLRELARNAGVSQAAPYRHFKNKEELIAEISKQGFQMKTKYMQEAIDRYQQQPLEMFYNCGLSYFRMGLYHPQHFKLMFNSGSCPSDRHPELMMAAAGTFVLLRDVIKVCQKAKIIGEGDPYLIAMNCWVLVHGFTTLYVGDQMKWLGINNSNAEAAFRQMLSQQLVGIQVNMINSSFKLFNTEESAHYKKLMDQMDFGK